MFSLTGEKAVCMEISGCLENSKGLAQELAQKILDNGGEEILDNDNN